MHDESPPESDGAARALRWLATVSTVALALWMIGRVLEILLLCFLGILFGLFVRGAGAWLATRMKLPTKPVVATFLLSLTIATTLTVWLSAPIVATQVDDLASTLPRAIDEATRPLTQVAWGRSLLDKAHDPQTFIGGREAWAQAGGMVSWTLGGLGSILVVLFVGLFTAFDPHLYVRGVIRLLPRERRARVKEVLYATGDTLQLWIVGKLLSMAVIGVGTWVGLAMLDIPLAFILALLAALLTFIPNFGPVLSAAPAILLALLQGPELALWVSGLYAGLQTVESFVFTPLVQKKMVALPPALTILVQVVMGALAGGIGVMVATPLTAATLVIVRELYVEDVLENGLPKSE